MNIRINMNTRAVRRLTEAQKNALELTADALITEVRTAQVMPFCAGTLQNDSTFADKEQSEKGIVRIVSSTPYARRLYFHSEYNFFHGKNANSGGKWFDEWLNGSKKTWCTDRYVKIYKRLSGV